MPSSSISPRNQFGPALRAVRKARGLSQEAFGLQSSRTYVSTLERGLKSPTLNKVDELAHVMDVHPITLLALAYTDLGHGRDIDRLIQKVTQELSSIREASQDGREKR
jgi:transcriptional regulator with XRE-family HTH domain